MSSRLRCLLRAASPQIRREPQHDQPQQARRVARGRRVIGELLVIAGLVAFWLTIVAMTVGVVAIFYRLTRGRTT